MSAPPSYPPEGFTLRVTEPSGKAHTHGADDGRTGWKLHAVRDGDEKAACGLTPRLGWGVDLFEDQMDDCKRCLVALDACRACKGDGRVSVLVSETKTGASTSKHYERRDCELCKGEGWPS